MGATKSDGSGTPSVHEGDTYPGFADPPPNTIEEPGFDNTTIPLGDQGEPEPPPVAPGSELVHHRYQDLGPLGLGGMGEVRRVRDRHLQRTVAMKIIRPAMLPKPGAMDRFAVEARATAQLQHPGIVPVHDLGFLPDGRLWFTMREVRGETLGEAIAGHFAAHPRGPRWTRRRLLEVMRRVCETIAYAHSQGVLHLDLKPSNIMLGPHDEVQVMDWGLARAFGTPSQPVADLSTITRQSAQDGPEAGGPRSLVAGTPGYMAPEQADGETDQLGPQTDVYALGAILFEIITGRRPYDGLPALEILDRMRRGMPPDLWPGGHAPSGSESALVKACRGALTWAPQHRLSSARHLADELQAWLDGDRQRDEAHALVREAMQITQQVQADRQTAAAKRKRASQLLADIPSWSPVAEKSLAWSLEAEAEYLHRQAQAMELEGEQLLLSALNRMPGLPEAHAELARRYRTTHGQLEALRKPRARLEGLLQRHALALPTHHPDRKAHLEYLSGDGALSLSSEPSGATVELFRFVQRDRREVPERVCELGQTPLQATTLPMGSHLCVITHPDCETVRLPIVIDRGGHLHASLAEGDVPQPVVLPPTGSLAPDDCYVPGSWGWVGGDPEPAEGLPRQRVWVPAFVMQRHPVTNREYLDFLNDLVRQGRTEEALAHAPRERTNHPDTPGMLLVSFDGTTFGLRQDGEGDLWHPDFPVVLVNFFGARAYARWEAGRTGLPWRLPHELEWERAARGTDGRLYPWGDHFDGSRACVLESHSGRPLPSTVDKFEDDESVCGVRGLAGNVVDWTCDPYTAGGMASPGLSPENAAEAPGPETLMVVRGGSWDVVGQWARSSRRGRCTASRRADNLGFRLTRSAEFSR